MGTPAPAAPAPVKLSPDEELEALQAQPLGGSTGAVPSIPELEAMAADLQRQGQTAANSPMANQSRLSQYVTGIGRGVDHLGAVIGNKIPGLNKVHGDQSTALGRLMGRGFTDEELAEDAQNDKPLMDSEMGPLGSLTGETIATAPIGGTARSAASSVLPVLRGTGLKSLMARGAVEGGTNAAVGAPKGESLTQGAWGTVLGGALPTGLKKAGNFAANGMERSAEAQALLDRGVDLPPGMMNPGGIWSNLEEKATNLPLVGDFFNAQRERARQQARQKVVQDVAPPSMTGSGLEQVPEGEIHDMISHAQKLYKGQWDAFDQLPLNATHNIPMPSGAPYPMQPQQAARHILQDVLDPAAHPNVPDASRAEASSIFRNYSSVIGNSGQGPMNVGTLRNVLEGIKAAKRDAYTSGDSKLGMLYQDADKRLTKLITDSLSPADAARFSSLNNQYARYKVVEGAVAKAKDNGEGGFTPGQLSTAVSQATSQGQMASGNGLMREWSAPFNETFKMRQPKTGVQNATLLAGEAGAGYLAAHNPPLAAGVAGAIAAPYTPMGRHFLQGKSPLNAPFRLVNPYMNSLLNDSTFGRAMMTDYARAHNVGPTVLGAAQGMMPQTTPDQQQTQGNGKALLEGKYAGGRVQYRYK
jgi:hypothetical protein